MTTKEYEKICEQTALYPVEHALSYVILGLQGEAGEIANKYKKVLRGDHLKNDVELEEVFEAITDELGDVLWYVARICSELNTDLETVMEMNSNKLLSRLERGTIKGSGDKR